MTPPGPPPKDPEKRARRNKSAEALSISPEDREQRAPQLPRGVDFQPPTRRWYQGWCSSPQAIHFEDTDWQRLHMLAYIVDAFFLKPSKELLGEIRLNEALLGATVGDRQRLSMKIEKPKKPSEKPAVRSRSKPDPRKVA